MFFLEGVDPPKSQKCQTEYCARDTPANSIHFPLDRVMEKPLFMIPLYQQPLNTSESPKRRITNNHSPTPTDPQIDAPVPQIVQDPPTFCPIIPAYYPHEAYYTLQARLRHQNAVEPFDIRSYILTPSLMDSMTCNTNAYAALKTSEDLQEGDRK